MNHVSMPICMRVVFTCRRPFFCKIYGVFHRNRAPVGATRLACGLGGTAPSASTVVKYVRPTPPTRVSHADTGTRVSYNARSAGRVEAEQDRGLLREDRGAGSSERRRTHEISRSHSQANPSLVFPQHALPVGLESHLVDEPAISRLLQLLQSIGKRRLRASLRRVTTGSPRVPSRRATSRWRVSL